MAEDNKDALHARKQAICRKAQRRHSRFYERRAHWSFNRSADVEPIRWHREHWMLAGTALLITLLSGFIMPAWASAMRPAPVPEAHTLLPLALPKVELTTAPTPTVDDWQVVRVQPGQTLSDIFNGRGLGMSDLQKVMDAAGDNKTALHNIRPGEEFDFLLGSDGSLKGFRFDPDQTTRAIIRLDGTQPTLALQQRDMDLREQVAHGVIRSSLYAAGDQAGMNGAMVGKLADLFKYDIDFVQDLRAGDSFTVIYDDIYRDGVRYGQGDIVAAEFINQGKRYTAYRFKKADGSYGWYSEDGRPIQKSFLRIPVDFTRISSRFSVARMHPILGYMRAHKGVDYAAPMGTPIHAAGDGVIKYHGWENGYGNFVVIQHSKTISTAYGHMSRFVKGQHVGEHVRQGEVIGYVGMTGLATGPHLHYEFRVNGVQRNPQTVTLPKPEPLPAAQLAKFESQVVKPQLARLTELDNRIKLARANAPPTTTIEHPPRVIDDATALYIGLISGTSADNIDAVLVRFRDGMPQTLARHAHPWPASLRKRMLALAQGEAALDLDAWGRLDVEIGHQFADAALQLLEESRTLATAVRAIGSHGQTLRHRPGGDYPFTLQLGDPSVIAERCRIEVVADFRRADVAAGGQGAPLLPALHAMLLATPGRARVVLNLGGIANITMLAADGSVRGFDTGPANGLLDAWCQRHLDQPFDRDGGFAASGQIQQGLLDALLADHYFALPPPKSTGREHFHLHWLATHAMADSLKAADVQATLLELSARSISAAIAQYAAAADDVLVCGGGVHNAALMRRLAELLAPRTLRSTAELGIDPDFLEATAFAWLARQRLLNLPGNLPAVTGARGPRVLGAIYSAPGSGAS